jgi:hypothetical protein
MFWRPVPKTELIMKNQTEGQGTSSTGMSSADLPSLDLPSLDTYSADISGADAMPAPPLPFVPFVPATNGIVNIPSVNDPLYLQAVNFWAGHFRCSVTHLNEAHARLGRYPSIERINTILKRLVVEDEFTDTRQQSTRQLEQQPDTVAMPLHEPTSVRRIAAWFKRKGGQ